MKNNTYIVYNSNTFKIIITFDFFGKDLNKLLKTDKSLKWFNITHPLSKDLLVKINVINKTNF